MTGLFAFAWCGRLNIINLNQVAWKVHGMRNSDGSVQIYQPSPPPSKLQFLPPARGHLSPICRKCQHLSCVIVKGYAGKDKIYPYCTRVCNPSLPLRDLGITNYNKRCRILSHDYKQRQLVTLDLLVGGCWASGHKTNSSPALTAIIKYVRYSQELVSDF